MKLITLTILILFAGVELGCCGNRWLNNKISPLNIHPSCRRTKTRILQAGMGECHDTKGCKIPKCCGIIVGTNSSFHLTYEAVVPLTSGQFHGGLGGVKLFDVDNPLLNIVNPESFLPSFGVAFDKNICNSSTCPQVIGKVYTLKLSFRFQSAIPIPVNLIGNFVARIINQNGDIAVCAGLHIKPISKHLLGG